MAKTNRKLIDLTGQVFGRLTVLREGTRKKHQNRRAWYCQCVCGSTVTVEHGALKTQTRSCGCLLREVLVSRKTRLVHGMTNTPEHRAWSSILFRCYNVKGAPYKNYGGRGIVACERWRNSFTAFYEDIGPRPSAGHSIERPDNDGGYWCGKCADCVSNNRPKNYCWATAQQQAQNRRVSHWITHDGQTLIVNEWARQTGLSASLILWRIKHKWSIHHALTTPARVLAKYPLRK